MDEEETVAEVVAADVDGSRLVLLTIVSVGGREQALTRSG